MATLTNCTATQYSAQEFPGDSVLDGNLELQTPPQGATLSIAFNQFYYLTIEPSPGFRINRTMVTLGNNNEGMIQTDGSINSVMVYNGISESDTSQFPSNLEFIRIYDSEPDTVTCDNKVIVEIKIATNFVMPDYDYTFDLDLNATALPCQVSTETSSWYTSFELIPLTAPTWTNPAPFMYAAKYYEEEVYVLSPYNETQSLFQNYSGLEQYIPLPDYDPNGVYNEYITDYYNNGELNSYAPTVYTSVIFDEDDLSYLFPQGPSGIFSNNAGQYFGTVSAFTPQNFDPEDLEDGITDNTGTHPNGAGRMYNTDTKLKYVWRGDTNNTSTIDNPELVPGDGIIPPALCWYVSLGNTNNYELIADSSFIKVVRILTTINQDEGWQSGEVLNNPPAQLFIGSQGLLQSRLAPDNETVDVNNSYLDITPSNIELTQIDSTTVKIKILFRDITIPWQQLPPSSPPYSVLPFPNTSRFTTKIFININPVEV